MNRKEEPRKALRSLPWYLGGSYLFAPLLAAPFTGGVSLVVYFIPFALLASLFGLDLHDNRELFFLLMFLAFAPGFLFWIFRAFFRAAWFNFQNHRQLY